METGSQYEYMRIRWTIRFLLLAAMIVVVIWIGIREVVPGGTLTVRYEPGRPSRLIKQFASKEPATILGTMNDEPFQVITKSPLYMDVSIPRPFAEATVELTYQTPDGQRIVQLGAQHGKGYVQKGVAAYEPALEKLPDWWVPVRFGDVVLWQKDQAVAQAFAQAEEQHRREKEEALRERRTARNELEQRVLDKAVSLPFYDAEKKAIAQRYDDRLADAEKRRQAAKAALSPVPDFPTLDAFFDHLPDSRSIVAYDYTIRDTFRISNYAPATQQTVLERSLRGEYEILTYVGKDEPLRFAFLLQDANRGPGEDRVVLELWKEDKKVATKNLDTFRRFQIEMPSEEKELSMEQMGLPEGLYTLKLTATDDVFTKRITTQQHLLMFRGKLYLAESDEYRSVLGNREFAPTEIVTGSRRVTVSTAHLRSLQTLTMNGKPLALEGLNEDEVVDNLQGLTRIVAPKNDIFLSGNGYFTFQEDQLIPLPMPVEFAEELDLEDFDYILAHYPQSEAVGDWQVVRATFGADEITFKRHSASFLVGLPGLSEDNRHLYVRRVVITLKKPPLTFSSILKKARSLFTHLSP